jgi:thiamine transporter ThiT
MNRNPIQPSESSSGLPGVLRLTAGLAIVALAILAALAVLDLLPREQVTSYGRRILLLALIVGLAAGGIAGLVRWGRSSR